MGKEAGNQQRIMEIFISDHTKAIRRMVMVVMSGRMVACMKVALQMT
jgi:hypothetical protein